jgi:uncharacterized membrane protein YeiH
MTHASALYLMDLAGVAVFAVSGALAAGRKSLDLLGVFIIATVTAIGGGTIRDVLINRNPVFWFADTIYLWVIIAATLFTIVYVRYRPAPLRALLVADALGLAIFAISGAQIAQNAGFGGIIAVILGTMTGSAGGMVRDILTTEIPLVLRDRDVYATAAIAGTTVYLWLDSIGMDRQIATYLGMFLVAGFRFGSIFWGLQLPVFHWRDEGPAD